MANHPDKIIFLDIDGVLNSWDRPAIQDGLMSIDPWHAANLEKVIAETDCWFVLSSTWRKCVEYKERLLHHGCPQNIVDRIIDKTPATMDGYRGREINWWLEHNDFKGHFLILDDDSDMVPHMEKLVQTNGQHGLTEEIASILIARLNGGKHETQKH